jgi:isocitrate dehydrogenase
MFSLHVKATMMKVSHPIVFGHCVQDLLQGSLCQARQAVRRAGRQREQRHGQPVRQDRHLPTSQREEIIEDLHACHEHRPELAMVDSAKGITNFHSPNDVIVDASMPAMIRIGGKMWGADGRKKDTKAVMPESTFARIYQEIINFCKTNGNFRPAHHGHRAQRRPDGPAGRGVRLARQDLRDPEDGVANIVDLATGEVLLSQNVEEGDIWRMCQVKDAPIRDWVKLAVNRARNSGMPPSSGSTPTARTSRADQEGQALPADHDTDGPDIQIMSQVRAMRYTLERASAAWTPSR